MEVAMGELICFFKKAIEINKNPHLTQDQKDKRLSELMTDMERVYNIPMLRNEQWERDNGYVISIYREISNMRNL
jgi:hypothetical protein